LNAQHWLAFLWLRWRLLANQWRRGGRVNFVLMMIVAGAALVAAVPLFAASCAVGFYAFRQSAPVHLLYAWDGVVVSFVFVWSIGLVTELQRTETLSLSKFLHLPVSIKSAFLINYVSSLLCLSLSIYVPILFGLGLGLAFAKGPRLLLALPLSAAFLLMATALTYQFQGWLASLMSNPRRRRTVVMAATAFFVLVFQVPNLLNVVGPWGVRQRADASRDLVENLAALNRGFEAHEFDAQELLRRQQKIIEQHQLESKRLSRQTADYWQKRIRLFNLLLPIGWLALGIMAAAEGNLTPALLGTLAMTLIGAGSLWRAYRTTLGLYQGKFTGRKSKVQSQRPGHCLRSAPSHRIIEANATYPNLLEARVAGLSEPVAAVALGAFRSLLRSPEAKMMLLTPLLLTAVLGASVLRRPNDLPVALRPLVAIGALVVVLFGMLQLMANQFGFDRDGFRVFILCGASRRDILFGKNLAFAPLTLALAATVLMILQVVCPLRIDHLLAMFPQFVSMFLLFCALTNLLSIYAPIAIAAGSLKPANPKLLSVLLQLAMFLFLFPLTQIPTLLPLGIEAILEWRGWTRGAPVYLALSLLQCAAVIFLYGWSLKWQGRLFQSREQKILETVTNRVT
jgi:ABC-2 type transport system permease protein